MENKLMTAKSYINCERVGEPFEKNGKPYQKVKEKCDRCSGHGIIVARVENGQLIPIPVDGGICYACGGRGYFIKEVRLYTEEEYNKIEAAKEKARQKKAEEQERKMKAEFAQRRANWLEKNNFSPDGYTYIYIGSDSYNIKDELKASGWRYDPVIKWHKADPAGYEDKAIIRHVEEFFEASAWGDYHYKEKAKDIADKLFAEVQPKSTSEWIGEVGDKVKDIKVQLICKYSMNGRYGLTTLYSFQDENENILNWWTTTYKEVEIGQWTTIKTATIKKLDEYKGTKQTILTRVKLV